MRNQQGKVRRSRMYGNKGSHMSGDTSQFSKRHRKAKKAAKSRM